MRLRAAIGLAILSCPSLFASSARADDTGIAADRFVPAPDARGFVGVEGAENALPWSAVVSLSYAAHLVRAENRVTGDRVSEPLSSVLAVDASGEVSLTPRISVGLGAPLALRLAGDRLANLGDARPLQSPVLGDVRLRARAILYGLRGGPFHLAASAVATFPAGGEEHLYATSTPTIEPRLVAEITLPVLRVAALGGYRFASERHLLDATFESELHLALAADAHLPFLRRAAFLRRVHALAELEATTGGTRTLEVRGALRLALPRVSIDAGFGAGALHAPTNPAYRVFVVLRTSIGD